MMPTGTAPYIATQLPLGVQLRDDASFISYEAGPNAELLQSLQALVAGQPGGLLYIHGPAGSGKTHLLQASCRAAVDAGQRAGYLPLAEFDKGECAVLEGMGNLPLLCLDDVQHVAAEQDWALLLMRLCEQARNPVLATSASRRFRRVPRTMLKMRCAACALTANHCAASSSTCATTLADSCNRRLPSRTPSSTKA